MSLLAFTVCHAVCTESMHRFSHFIMYPVVFPVLAAIGFADAESKGILLVNMKWYLVRWFK